MMDTPWIALAILVAVLVIPSQTINRWLEGPRTITHHPHRHVCGACGAPNWTPDHSCSPAQPPVHEPSWGELRRVRSPRPLVGRSRRRLEIDDR
jgi:hypothetical protein